MAELTESPFARPNTETSRPIDIELDRAGMLMKELMNGVQPQERSFEGQTFIVREIDQPIEGRKFSYFLLEVTDGTATQYFVGIRTPLIDSLYEAADISLSWRVDSSGANVLQEKLKSQLTPKSNRTNWPFRRREKVTLNSFSEEDKIQLNQILEVISELGEDEENDSEDLSTKDYLKALAIAIMSRAAGPKKLKVD